VARAQPALEGILCHAFRADIPYPNLWRWPGPAGR